MINLKNKNKQMRKNRQKFRKYNKIFDYTVRNGNVLTQCSFQEKSRSSMQTIV